jgi:quinol monooxygenase YgiN
MYGTLARVRPKQGRGQEIIRLTERWISERGADVPGFIADYLLVPDNGQGDMLILSVFASQGAYRANADTIQQDRWYREFRAALESDPEWSDGEIIAFEGARVPL